MTREDQERVKIARGMVELWLAATGSAPEELLKIALTPLDERPKLYIVR